MILDYLIVGQGLAGTALATTLLSAGKRIALIDERKWPTSSSVAAGLINPFTGPKMVKSWNFDELIGAACTYYREAEKQFGRQFFQEKIIFRPFASVADQNDWYGRSTGDGYRNYIIRLCEPDVHAPYIHNPFGGMEIRGWVLNTKEFLDGGYQFLAKNCTYIKERFDENLLKIQGEGVHYGDLAARRIIFCMGHKAIYSRWFHWLPVVPVKGELLVIKMKSGSETIYNRNCFIIPQGQGFFLTGSTYDRDDLSPEPTERGKQRIMENIRLLTDMTFEVSAHSAGIRPGTLTRRPLIGRHPEIGALYIFNGLGTKGVSLAPYFARQFVLYLEQGNNLDTEVDIKKYNYLYFKSQSPN